MTETRRAVFVISVAAELAGMHPQTLRIYERKGLLEPARTPGGTRRYSQEDIERLQLIQELTSQGLNLEGVRRVLALQEENRTLKRKVDRLRDKLDDLEEEMERTCGRGASFLPPRHRPPLPAAARHRRGPVMADSFQGPVRVLGGDGILLTTGSANLVIDDRDGRLEGHAGDSPGHGGRRQGPGRGVGDPGQRAGPRPAHPHRGERR